MRYDAKQGCYLGEWLAVPAAVFEQALAARVAAGETPDAALDELLDELSWSLDVPGVAPRFTGRDLRDYMAARMTLPWPLRFRVPIVHSDAARAEELRLALEAAGVRAPVFVAGTTTDLDQLRAVLTPAPGVCVIGQLRFQNAPWRVLKAELPACCFVLTTPPDSATAPLPLGVHWVWHPDSRTLAERLVRAVRGALLQVQPESPTVSARSARAIQRAGLLSAAAAAQGIRSLALRGQAHSLRKRDRRARVKAAMLRKESAVYRGAIHF